MYIPTGAKTLADNFEHQYRILIQGPPGSGKTYSALTFPNPVVGNHDRGLVAHQGRKDVTEIPFYDPSFAKPNRLEKYKAFLRTEMLKLEAEQTYIDDSWTSIQDSFDESTPASFSSSTGREDKFVFWKMKMDFSRDVCDSYKKLKCNVILICHETPERDDNGRITGLKPLQQGQFADKLGSYFTDIFRMLVIPKHASEDKLKPYKLEQFGCKSWAEFVQLYSLFPDSQSMFVWQTKPDDYAKCKTCLLNPPLYIPATYEYYKRYRRQFPTCVG